METILQKWDEILALVKEEHELTDVSFSTWLKPLKVHSLDETKDGTILYLLVPSAQVGVNYVSKKYTLPLKVAIAEITGINCDVRFILPEEASKMEKRKAPSPAASLNVSIEKANLNPKYTFATFVVGPNNQLVHAASLAVAESPGEAYNPLFIYGDVGLGKTHLMHSIAHFILERNPETKVLYVTSESFTNELIEAIRNGNNTAMSKFREKYRNIDVLLIDDIQFIIGKESTQEEFFHTFNDLHGAKKQIIISSDKPPKEMQTLEGRLRSRFEWGLIADISSPDYETRMAILRKKEELDGYSIDDDVIQYIATNIKSNIRELEGALNKLIACSRLENKEITIQMAEEELRDIISPDEKRIITPDVIIETVAEHFGITPGDIKGNKRNSEIVKPRQIAMYLCRYLTETPLKQIGAYMGKKDHSTVLHGVRAIEGELQTSESLKSTVDVIKKKLSPG